MNPYQLFIGDAAESMAAHLRDETVDLIVTSPKYDKMLKYGGHALNWAAVIQQSWRVLTPGGVLCWVVQDQTEDGGDSLTSFRQALYMQSLGFHVSVKIYETVGTGAKGDPTDYWKGHEYILVAKKGRPKTVNLIQDRPNKYAGQTTSGHRRTSHTKPKTRKIKKYGRRTSVWRYGTGGRPANDFPARMPEELARDLIYTWSKPGDLVVDPMVGSGTVGEEALKLGRRFWGNDIWEYAIEEHARPNIEEIYQDLQLWLLEEAAL